MSRRWWQGIYGVALVSYVVGAGYTLLHLKQVPGCLYGCDVYFHKGIVESLIRNFDVLGDPTQLGEHAYYPWLLHLAAAVAALVSGATATTATIALGFVVPVVSSLLVLALSRPLFDGTWERYALAIAPLSLHVFHPLSLFASVIAVGLVLTLAGHAAGRPSHRLVLLFTALAPLTHVSAGIFAYALTTAWFAVSGRRTSRRAIGVFCRRNLFWIIVALGLPLLYYGPLLAHYGLQTPNPYHRYAGRAADDTALTVVLRSLGALLRSLNVVGIVGLVFAWCYRPAVLKLIGVFLAVYVALAAAFLGRGDFLLVDRFSGFFPALALLSFALALDGLGRAPLPRRIRPAALALIVAVVVYQAVSGNQAFFDDRWHRMGFEANAFAPVETALRRLPPDAVVLSNSETSFALFSLAGTKTVLFRRTHGNPFVDYDGRAVDVANLLYTRDDDLVARLIARYRIRYVFLDDVAASEPISVPLSRRGRLDAAVPGIVGPFRFDPAVADGLSESRFLVPFRIAGRLRDRLRVKEILSDGRRPVGMLLEVRA